MQKRGVFVDAEDFLPVTSTYPAHPLSEVVPHAVNVAEMKDQRRGVYKEDVFNKSLKHEAHNLKVGKKQHYVRSEFLVEKPQHNSINERVAENRVAARQKAGLTNVIQDPKDEIVESREPLEHITAPKFGTKVGLAEHRRMAMLEELKKNEANFETHKDAQTRIENREMCHLRAQHKDAPTLTKPVINQRRKEELIEDMTKKFGKVTVGVHGMELP